jgi:hypothetical protein
MTFLLIWEGAPGDVINMHVSVINDAFRFYTNEVLARMKQSDESGQWTCPQEDKSTLLIAEVAAVAGRLLLFDQRLVHEGVRCTPPHRKYILRSDIMYHRIPPVCDSTTDRVAYALFREAEGLAEAGEVERSIPLFKKACKLSPTLAAFMGH